jgi:glycosyltransferase involved in cell wall biosynthesis
MESPIHVLIATAGRPDLLRRTLASIAECGFPSRYAGMIIVENGARRGAKDVVAEFSGEPLRARYLFSDAPNKSRALNLALQQLEDADLVVFTDDDVRVGPAWLESYDEASQGIERGYTFGGPFGVDYEKEPTAWLRTYLPPSGRGMSEGQQWPLTTSGLRGFVGCNWAGYVADLREAGGFNDRVGPGTLVVGQETDMQRRLQELGCTARLVPAAMVWHYVPVERCSEEWILQRAYRLGRSVGRQEWNRIETAAIGTTAKAAARLRSLAVRNVLAVSYGMKSLVPVLSARSRFDARWRHERYRGWVRSLRGSQQ